MRRAMTGDPCGWKEVSPGVFKNSETGETAEGEKPQLLVFAEVEWAHKLLVRCV